MLRIPKDYHEGLAHLVAVGEETFNQLLAALREVPPTFTYLATTKALELRVPAASPAELASMTEALFATYSAMVSADVPPTAFVADLIEAIRTQVAGIEPQSLANAKDRLRSLYTIDSLTTTAKAKVIISDHEHSLCTSRLFTDIRPIFRDIAEEGPKALMLVHTLKLAYHEGGELKEFFVAMDGDDLEALYRVTERAREKAKALKEFITRTDVPYLGVEN
jgi:hypothetical protein